MVAALGAVPWPQSTWTFLVLAEYNTAGTSPAGPTRCGSTTCSTKAEATQASKALPPRSSIAMPAAEASQWVEVTMPKVPRISGRVVNMGVYPVWRSWLFTRLGNVKGDVRDGIGSPRTGCHPAHPGFDKRDLAKPA